MGGGGGEGGGGLALAAGGVAALFGGPGKEKNITGFLEWKEKKYQLELLSTNMERYEVD